MAGSLKDEPTLAHPDHVETVDVLGAKARAARARDTGEPTPTDDREEEAAAPVKIGRYRLLELVGSGGMGMVWGAWDPQLERRVAIKLVRFTSERSHERMLREGQVLAKLSHPNLVPIFDVGVMGGQVYLVMEWIKGVTLRGYGESKPGPKALLAAYRQAGEGLVAAHRAGVIHRDFKPDNAIRGDDGRVRVLDFGLAQEAGDTDAPHAGTPRYMAPEQARGEGVSEASDQYSFCVSLREALEAAGGVPGWITACIDRGTMANPADRYPAMDELLAQLARDPARRVRRIALVVVVAGAAAGAFAFGRARSADTVEPCSGGTAELAASWGPAVRDRATTHLRELGPVAEAERVVKEIDAYATTWVAESRAVCLANERHELTPAIHARRVECLARTKSQLGAVGELLGTVDPKRLDGALLAASSLPDSRGCAEETGTVLPPPAAMAEQVKAAIPYVERALVLTVAQQPDAIDEASAATIRAKATNYQPLIARALIVEGRAKANTDNAPAQLFAEAMRLALRSSDEVLAVEAYARWVFANVVSGHPATDHWDVMVEIADRLGRSGRVARALMYENHAQALLAADDRDGARRMYETALAAAGDSDDIELVSIQQNLAQLESPEEAQRRFRIAADRYAAALGPDHPETLGAEIQVAMLTPDRGQAAAALEAAYRGLERWHAAHPSYAQVLGWIADESGDRASAARWMERSIGSDPNVAAIATAYVALERGAADVETHLAHLEKLATTLDTSAPWDRAYAADALVLVARYKPEVWERVLALLENKPMAITSRPLARARRMVAERWAATRPADARRVAEQALAWYRRAPGDVAIVAQLEEIVATAKASGTDTR